MWDFSCSHFNFLSFITILGSLCIFVLHCCLKFLNLKYIVVLWIKTYNDISSTKESGKSTLSFSSSNVSFQLLPLNYSYLMYSVFQSLAIYLHMPPKGVFNYFKQDFISDFCPILFPYQSLNTMLFC